MSSHQAISLELENVTKSFAGQDGELTVLRGISLSCASGDALAITGPSGSGKSTILHIVGTLDPPTSGTVKLNNQEPFSLPEKQLAKFRNEVIGFVFQDHHLLPQYSVLENVLIPAMAFRGITENTKTRALALLERVGLTQRLSHRPAQLSGGERQRAAIARALVNQPSLLLCDEPTGNLDHKTAKSVASLLFELHQQERNIMIAVTHSLELADRFGRRLELSDGQLEKPGTIDRQ